jgi:hypothetical protein
VREGRREGEQKKNAHVHSRERALGGGGEKKGVGGGDLRAETR